MVVASFTSLRKREVANVLTEKSLNGLYRLLDKEAPLGLLFFVVMSLRGTWGCVSVYTILTRRRSSFILVLYLARYPANHMIIFNIHQVQSVLPTCVSWFNPPRFMLLATNSRQSLATIQFLQWHLNPYGPWIQRITFNIPLDLFWALQRMSKKRFLLKILLQKFMRSEFGFVQEAKRGRHRLNMGGLGGLSKE